MTSESTTRWPLFEERTPFVSAPAPERSSRRRLPRSAWLLTALAFLCGGLVSAAAFSIGWRHQAQRDTAARAALATATAHVNRLSASLATARETIAQEQQAQAEAAAAVQAVTHAAASLATQATSAGRAADTVSGEAADIADAASRVSRELQTLLTYVTTTPSSQIDSGYIASQTAYLTRQLTALEDSGVAIGRSATSFQAAVKKLNRDTAAIARR